MRTTITGLFFHEVIRIENRLRQLREERKLTQTRVAMDLFLNQNSVSRYESGAREAGYALLIRFADYYRLYFVPHQCAGDKLLIQNFRAPCGAIEVFLALKIL